MGRLSNEPVIQHFSHPHPLRLSSLDQQQQQSLAPPTSCANCRLPARGGYGYACSPCGYVLHVQCSQMPPLIHHASHQAHPLSLLPVPAYPEGSFDCDACARPGTGFSYHCAACGLDLHTLCASLPLSLLPDPALHPHPLSLAFAPPYDNKAFSCDVCGGLASTAQWLYRCAPCEFDAHLECGGRRRQDPAPVGRSGSVAVQGSPRAAAVSRSGSGGIAGLARAGSAGGMVRQMVQGMVGTTTQHIGSRFVPGYAGDGGGAAANGGGRGGGRGRGRGGGYNGWNGNGGGGRGGGPPGAWNGYGGGGGGGRGQGGGSGGPGVAGNDPNAAQASYDYGGNGNYGYVDSSAGDVSGGWNGYEGGDGGGGGGNGDGVDYGSVVDAVAGVDYGSVVDAVAGVGSAVLNAFGGGSDDN